MIALAPMWQPLMPDALFLAPNAPQRCSYVARGYQWWPLTGLDPVALATGARHAAPAIDAFIEKKLAQYGLSETDLALVGFSQGTMMALQVGLRRKEAVASIVGYSGMLTGGRDLAPDAITRPPVLLIHGASDPVVPVAALHAAKADLQRLNIPVRDHVAKGVGHTVDPVGLRMGAEFVAEHFR